MTKPIPDSVWFNGCAFQDLAGRTFAPWGVLGRRWWPRRLDFPRTAEACRANLKDPPR